MRLYQRLKLIGERSRSRDELMACAAGGLAFGAAMFAISEIFGIVSAVDAGQPPGLRIAAVFKPALDLILIPGFVLLCVSFLGEVDLRSRRIEIAATVIAGAEAVGLVGSALATEVSLRHGYSETYVAMLITTVILRCAALLAALLVATAFADSSSASSRVFSGREDRLRWAGLALGFSYLMALAGQVLLIAYLSGHGEDDEVIVALCLAASGSILAAVASCAAAFGFSYSGRRDVTQAARLKVREARLSIAAVLFSGSFSLMCAAAVVQAAGSRSIEVSGTLFLTFSAAGSFTNVLAGAFVAIGCSRSIHRRPSRLLARS